MQTIITNRKTPHAVINTVYGSGIDLVYAWCFENDNPEDKLIQKWIPKTHCYVRENLQDLPDYMFRSEDVRKFHVDVWNEKCKNHKNNGKFLTNYEYNQYLLKKEQNHLNAIFFMNFFE